ncbi:PspC domain-containing protein [Lactobacillus sp. R2/2]|nr:PspC domain-containing protein [Lactobacillus sp. R2/2]
MQKRLTKSDDRVLFGVLGGVAEYFGWDKAWTRIGGAF